MDQIRRTFRTTVSTSASVLCFLAMGSATRASRAEEPRLASEPYLLLEPAEVTQVVDAFDAGDPFDLHLSVGYQYSNQSSNVLRESVSGGDGQTLDVARYKETTHRLNTRMDIGLYHDIALVLRMPIVLANDRSLEQLGNDATGAGTAGATYNGQTETLFTLPFHAPTRSGIEYLAVGFDFGIMNQYRDATKPTWVFGFEGRFDLSSPMHACDAHPAAGQLQCADPGDVNRDGKYDPNRVDSTKEIALESASIASRKAGVARGTTGLELHTYISKRLKYIEPYGGLRMLAEFPTSKSDYNLVNFEASLVNKPPLEGTFIVGMAVIPWEVRSNYQRTTLDFRFASTYRSEGRDYSELFDAIGSSPASSLRVPAWSGYQASPSDATKSVINPNSRRVYFNGLTDVQQHIKNRFSTEFTWQAAKYVKFGVGIAYTVIQSHYITYDQACNANFTDTPDVSGPCRKDNSAASSTPYNVTGIPNPNYRQSINAMGRRYLVSGSDAFDGWLNATVMF
ncbi:MAG TPA: hypothetical protein VIV60_37405 [Polyangiaceae bacterium]